MRCSCKECGTYMIQAESDRLGCICPECGYRCNDCLGTDTFVRIRVGTGAKPEGWDLADWVLSRICGEDREKIDEALALTGLKGMRKRNMLTLSGGEQQRVFLAQVFCQDPNILILDEPANHLDLPFQKELFSLIGEWLKTPGRAVITVMHDLSLARKFGTHTLLMDRGRCAGQGKASEVLTPEALQAVYGMDVYGWIRELLDAWN